MPGTGGASPGMHKTHACLVPPMTARRTIVVAHTHWDREWYMPFNLFRFRLVAMMDALMDILERDPSFTSFMLDGQASILEDYLEIKPDQRPRLERLAQEGRLVIGPFYVQNSPWLQTGEGYVRNLLKGHAIARAFGVRSMKVGYIPDQYVHFEQLPQVLRGFGIKAMAFSRGMGNQQDEHGLGFEFEWTAPDGSSIVGLHLAGGYGQCSALSDDPMAAVDTMVFSKGRVNKIKHATRWGLLFSGDDHRLPERALPRAIEAWNAIEEIVEDEGTLELGTLEGFVDAVLVEKPQLPAYKGEIRGSKYSLAFQGVFSSCMPLKQASFATHDMLEKQAEPLAAIARAIAGKDYRGFLREAWKQLLLNQPHDSSWTASWDPVMDEMATRCGWAMQNATETRNWALLDITSRVAVPSHSDKQVEIVLFNPLAFDRREAVSLVVPVSFELERGYVLLDPSGQRLASTCSTVAVRNEEIKLVRKFVGSHGPRPARFYRLDVEPVEVPALGFATLVLLPGPAPQATGSGASPVLVRGNMIENEAVAVVVATDGSFTVTDKRTGRAFPGLNVFEDAGDAGDGYEYKPVQGDVPVTSRGTTATITPGPATAAGGTLVVKVPMRVPEGLNDDCTARAARLVPLDITTTLALRPGADPIVDITVSFENLARDHRLAVTFPTGLQASAVEVDGHFGITSRPVDLPDATGWAVEPVPQAPQHGHVNVAGAQGTGGFLLANRGLPEYEATRDPDGTVRLGLTLLRATGGWGRHINKNSPVSVRYPQLLGPHELHYAIIPHDGLPAGHVHRLASAYRHPVHAEYRGAHNKYQGYFPNVDAPVPFLAMTGSFLRLEPADLVLSAVKDAEDGDGIIARVFNLSRDATITGTLETSLGVKGVEEVSLEEDPASGGGGVVLDHAASAVILRVAPASIVSLRLRTA